jgi:predicted GNAT family N-acyltransferase
VSEVRIARASWAVAEDREAMTAIRHAVFVVEQGVPVDLELDGLDPACVHLVAFGPQGDAIGTARMTGSGHVGRIAVLAPWRGRGVGARLVRTMLALARDAGLGSVDLDSQVRAVGFYEKLGFEARGEEFMEAGIPHRNMVLELGA